MICTFNPTAGRVAEWTEGELQNSEANQSNRLISARLSYRHYLKKGENERKTPVHFQPPRGRAVSSRNYCSPGGAASSLSKT